MCPVQTVTHVSGRSSFQINGLQPSFLSRHPQLWNIWERLEKESLLDSQLHAGVFLESHACKSSAWFRRWHIPIAAARSWRARRYRAGPQRVCDAVDATLLAQVLPPLPPASARVPEDYSRGAVRPTGSGRVSLPGSIWRRTSCDALPRVCVLWTDWDGANTALTLRQLNLVVENGFGNTNCPHRQIHHFPAQRQ